VGCWRRELSDRYGSIFCALMDLLLTDDAILDRVEQFGLIVCGHVFPVVDDDGGCALIGLSVDFSPLAFELAIDRTTCPSSRKSPSKTGFIALVGAAQRCTADPEKARPTDQKQVVSRDAVRRCVQVDSKPLFVRRKGGINECAARFTRQLGRGARALNRGMKSGPSSPAPPWRLFPQKQV
jgi:hypothetical protein